MVNHLQPLYSWVALFEENDAKQLLIERLKPYLILAKEIEPLAHFGLNEAYKRAERRNVLLRARNQVDEVTGAFAKRWLRNVSYNESLRIVLETNKVRPLLSSLIPEDRVLLQWRYTEQSTDDDFAAVFSCLDSRSRISSELARIRSRQAYDSLCALVEQSLTIKGKELNPWEKQYRFPRFPGVCLDHKPRC